MSIPRVPIAGEKVAEELKGIPHEGFEDFWEWVDRIDKYGDVIDTIIENKR